MAGWHHQLNGHGFGWTLGVGDGQGGLACCDSRGGKESDTTEHRNRTELHRPVGVGSGAHMKETCTPVWTTEDHCWPGPRGAGRMQRGREETVK